ncbi:RPM1-interacting protein 4-like isoform X2 [Impatiens glandulifera]|uniref:RPM1-interacting protein 4-like isoform X2 n=1 Tax=Impatiens glandulifera TaxID=253017 RepID=UPI001FB068E3|nr:RPM1-interacting protein 4-like isoform X2 [Impatiens glandulifera]
MTSRTPEFGKWDDEDVPYSQVFDKARKNRADKKSTQDNPYDSLGKSPKHETRKPLDGRSPRHERRISREEIDLKRLTDSPLMPLPTSSPYHHRHGTTSSSETPKRTGKQSVGSDRGFDHSPLHPQQNQTRVSGTVIGSGVSSEGSHSLTAPSTPGRSRLRQIPISEDTSDQSAVPRFGDWDETDPTAAEGFTEVFDRVRQERQNVEGGVPTTRNEFSRSYGHQQPVNQNSKKCCRCFPWGGM